MKTHEAFNKIRDAMMSVYDGIESEEYCLQLWTQVFHTMRKHKLILLEVKVGYNLPTKIRPMEEPPPRPADTDIDTGDEPEMPFGKYAGTAVSKLPIAYVRWAVENVTFTNARFRRVEQALKDRLAQEEDGDAAPLSSEEVPY